MEIVELKQSFETLHRDWAAFKETNEKREKQVKEYGDALGQTTETLGKIQSALDAQEEKIGKIQTSLERPDPFTGEAAEVAMKKKAALMKYLKSGRESLTPEEVKGLSERVSDLGGFLAPAEYVNEIIKGVTEMNPLRGVCRVRPTSSGSVEVPKRTGTFSASWAAEASTRTETTGLAFGLEKVPVHTLYALVKITHEQLEDSAFSMEQIVREEATEQFAYAEGKAFVAGTSVGQPEGLTVNPGVLTNYVAGGSASAVIADGIIDLLYALKEEYAMNATFVMKRSTLKAVRKLKDGNGQYLWAPGIAGGAPATILDRPYIQCADMPAVAQNAYAMACGDFKRGYLIVDRIGLAVERVSDSQTQDEGGIRVYARRRVGGQVINVEAIKVMKIATS